MAHKKNMEKSLSGVRMKKLRKLRMKIESGKYRISTQELAKALILAN